MTDDRSPSAFQTAPARRMVLIYGNRESAINEAKLDLLRLWIPLDEERRENVAEILPPTNRSLVLQAAIPQLAAELGQQSLFGDSMRIVVVYQLHEFFSRPTGGRGKTAAKASAAKTAKTDKPEATPEFLLDKINELVRDTGNAIVFIAVEDEAKFHLVNEKSPFFQAVLRHGVVRKFAAKSMRFELSDAIVARSLPEAMRIVTAWRLEDKQAAPAIFRTLLDDVHCLLQALILERQGEAINRDPAQLDLFFPPELKPHLPTLHDFRKRKYILGLRNYPDVRALLEALRGLLDIQKALYPTGEELYIPDVNYLTDIWLARLLGSR